MRDYDEVIKAAKMLPPSAALFDLIAAYEEAEKRAGQLEKELKAVKAELRGIQEENGGERTE